MYRPLVVALALALSAECAAAGGLSIRLELVPSVIRSFEPAPVVFSVRNDGPDEAVLPIDVDGAIGSLDYRRVGTEEWRSTALHVSGQSGTAKRAEILAAGTTRFTLAIASHHFDSEGRYEVRARLWSGGQCMLNRAASGAPSVPSEEGIELVSCTEVQLESDIGEVEVVRPQGDVDKRAFEFLGRPTRVPFIVGERYKELVARFPTSHYTYAAAYRANLLEDAIRLQPEHPLNGYLVALRAARRLSVHDCCEHRDLTFAADATVGGLPAALRRFVTQQEAERGERCRRTRLEQCPNGRTGEESPRTEGGRGDRRAAPYSEGGGMAARRLASLDARSDEERRLHRAATDLGGASSAMGFKHNLILSPAPAPTIYWISLPYRYEPEDVGTIGMLDAEDLCHDLTEAGVATAVLRWNEATSTIVEHICDDPNPFVLAPGTAYGFRRAPNTSLSANLAGGHDESFTFSIPATGGSQLSWISVPYHIKDAGNQSPVTAEGLCQQIGSSEVLAIVRFDSSAGSYRAYGCGSAFESPFPIAAGEGFGVINRGSQTISWQPIHY